MDVSARFVLFAACVACNAPGLSTPAAAPCQAPSASAASPKPSIAAPLNPSPGSTPPATFDVAAIDEYLARQVASRGFVGLSVAIVKDGAVVLDKGYGLSRLAPETPTQADTPFLTGSITKQFVAAIVLVLAGEKKLSLEDKVAKYFPELTRADDITLYDLVTHVSGYRDNYPLDFVDEEMKRPVAPDEAIARYAKRPLDFEPRTRFSYSSTGYKILGRVIEKVSGKPLGVVLEERMFRPLGMTHSSYMPAPDAPGLARGYTSFGLGLAEPAEPEGAGWLYGSSGIYAPAGDIAKWNVALMSGRALNPEAYKLFSAPRRLADGRMTTYGCGIKTRTNRGGEQVLEHGGGDSGFVGWSYLIPRTRDAVVILSNRDDAGPWDLVAEIVELLNKEHRPPALKILGPPADRVGREILAALQSARVDRSRFGEDFNLFLTEAKIESASARLGPLGDPTRVDVESALERGGMEQATVVFTFVTTKLRATMFRSVDGKVQQFLLYRM